MGCFALALRFLIVGGLDAEDPVAFLLLAGGVAATALWNPLAAFRAVALLFPLLFGLGRMNLLAVGSAETVALAALSVAALSRALALRLLGRIPWGPPPDPPGIGSRMLGLADALAVWTLISFGWWLHGRLGDASTLRALAHQPIFGFSDVRFPVTDTLIWLLGWYYLRELVAGTRGASYGRAGEPACPSGAQDGWICLCLLCWAACTAVFFVLQDGLGLADGFNYDPKFSVPTSMFNDPHTFGGVAASLAVMLALISRERRSRARILTAAGAAVMLLFVFLCYSRAAWFASAAVFGAVLLAGHRRIALVLGLLVLLGAGLVAWRSDDLLRLNRPYLTRIVYSVRLDRLMDNREARFVIYRRVPAMVSAYPLLGQGPGASRVSSIPFVHPTDPFGPEFVHDAVLQAAVEQGVPAGAALLALLVLPLGYAFRWRHRLRADPVAAAAALGLLAFLLTQLTSNSINVYLDQQVFLWTLTALLIGRLGPPTGGNPQSIGRAPSG